MVHSFRIFILVFALFNLQGISLVQANDAMIIKRDNSGYIFMRNQDDLHFTMTLPLTFIPLPTAGEFKVEKNGVQILSVPVSAFIKTQDQAALQAALKDEKAVLHLYEEFEKAYLEKEVAKEPLQNNFSYFSAPDKKPFLIWTATSQSKKKWIYFCRIDGTYLVAFAASILDPRSQEPLKAVLTKALWSFHSQKEPLDPNALLTAESGMPHPKASPSPKRK